MKLAEFYSMNENKRYVIEHESNGVGRLLCWEEDYSDLEADDDAIGGSFEVLAKGDIEKLIRTLPEGPERADAEDDIRNFWEDAISTGDGIEVVSDGNSYHVSMVPKHEEDDSSYDSNEDELY